MHPRRTRSDPTAAARRLALIAAGTAQPSPPLRPAEAGPEPEDAWWADHTRIAALPLPVPEPVQEPVREPSSPAPVIPSAVIPSPGRHAARQGLLPTPRSLRDALPSLAPAHVAVVALVVALGLGLTAWSVVRADPGPAVVPVAGEEVSPLVTDAAAVLASGAPSAFTSGATTAPAPGPGSGPAAGAGGTSGSPAGTAAGSVTVDVAGKVRRPGIVVLGPGTRVVDALRAAGGAKPGVDTSLLNLARVLVDGEQIVVGGPAPPAGPAASGPGASPGAAPGPGAALVDLNRAGQAELESLPQVGPVTAQAIIAWRDQRGGFTSVEELLEVEGIAEKTLARLAPYVTV